MIDFPPQIGPVALEKVERRIVLRFERNDTIRRAIKAVGAKFVPDDSGGPYWWIGVTKADQIVRALQEVAPVVTDQAQAEVFLKHSHTFECRRGIQELGGVWDGKRRGWVLPDQEAWDKAMRLCESTASAEREDKRVARDATKRAPGNWSFRRAVYAGVCQYTGMPFEKGEWIWWSRTEGAAIGTLEHAPQLPTDPEPLRLTGNSVDSDFTGWFPGQLVSDPARGWLCVLRARCERIRDPRFEGYRYDAWCRTATPDEVAAAESGTLVSPSPLPLTTSP